ncbi:hypothetical protein GCL60_11965 [Silvanigrella paludirubra]|uniref:Uncharacterized protein n=1 Tax=Silvanigrella paludirubra TaxID=2499159 RepID=A0A6N6VS19_9BACT|nr:hypothetical protein [Silvanigrella paludirubra]KAB8037883.1 hypothetical protein GCL60_11965 [Silvanigrella paludirubra]
MIHNENEINILPPNSIIKYPRTDGHHTSEDVKESASPFLSRDPFESAENNDVPTFLQFAAESANPNCVGAEVNFELFQEAKSKIKNIVPFKEGWPKFGNDQKHTNYLLTCFKDIPEPVTLEAGTKVYRLVGALNNEYKTNDYCGEWWALEPPPATEAMWRSGYAVWDHWNGDGGYIEYTIGKEGLNVWLGITGPQSLQDNEIILRGGKIQIWVPQNTINPLKNGFSKKDITKRSPWNFEKEN